MIYNKEDHEKWTSDKLIACLGIEAKYLRHGKDGEEPDQIYELPKGIKIGIEVTIAYYDNHLCPGW